MAFLYAPIPVRPTAASPTESKAHNRVKSLALSLKRLPEPSVFPLLDRALLIMTTEPELKSLTNSFPFYLLLHHLVHHLEARYWIKIAFGAKDLVRFFCLVYQTIADFVI